IWARPRADPPSSGNRFREGTGWRGSRALRWWFRSWTCLLRLSREWMGRCGPASAHGITPGAKPGGEFAKIPRNQAFALGAKSSGTGSNRGAIGGPSPRGTAFAGLLNLSINDVSFIDKPEADMISSAFLPKAFRWLFTLLEVLAVICIVIGLI